MCAWGNQAESSCLEARSEGLNIINPELDLDFAVGSHSASIKEERIKQAVVARPKKLLWRAKR